MFTSYDIKINLPKMPEDHTFRPLVRKQHPVGHPFHETSFWRLSVLHSDSRIRVCYFKTPAGEEVPWHHDGIAWTTFNYVLEGDSPMVYKTGEEYYYKCGLFDVRQEHMVPVSTSDRVLLKFSMLYRPYEEIKPLLDDALKEKNVWDYEEILELLK